MSSFWNFDELDQLHIELTNGCNAACPMCVRFMNSSPLTRPDLKVQHITLEKFKKWVNPEVLSKIRLILFCGVHGDPCASRDFYEICKYIDETNPNTRVDVNTNGGMRTPDWWSKVGKLFHKKLKRGWNITFSIDGLEDTNHIYRRNVNWNKLMENVKAFISEGGQAEWDYLVFEHNEWQIEEAKELSKQLGFRAFIPKKALGVDNGTSLKAMGALNKEGKLDYWIHAPSQKEYRNLENPAGEEEYISWEFDVEYYRELKKGKSKKQYWLDSVDKVYENRIPLEDLSEHDNCNIYCKSQNRRNDQKMYKEVFIDCSGIVMPCCYMATHLNSTYSSTETLQLHNHMNKYGWEHFDLHKHSLKEILNQKHLDTVFADTWEKPTVLAGKTLYCAMTCGRVSHIDKIFTHKDVANKKFTKKLDEIKAWHEKNN